MCIAMTTDTQDALDRLSEQIEIADVLDESDREALLEAMEDVDWHDLPGVSVYEVAAIPARLD